MQPDLEHADVTARHRWQRRDDVVTRVTGRSTGLADVRGARQDPGHRAALLAIADFDRCRQGRGEEMDVVYRYDAEQIRPRATEVTLSDLEARVHERRV